MPLNLKMEDLKMNRYFRLIILTVVYALSVQNSYAWFWSAPVQVGPVQVMPGVPTQPGGGFRFVDTRSGDELLRAGFAKKKEEVVKAATWYAAVLGAFCLGSQFQLVKNQGISSLWCNRDGVIRLAWTYTPLSVVCAGAVYGAYKTGLLKKAYNYMLGFEQQQAEEIV